MEKSRREAEQEREREKEREREREVDRNAVSETFQFPFLCLEICAINPILSFNRREPLLPPMTVT